MPIKIKDFRAVSAGVEATPRVGLLRLERLAGILEDAHKHYVKANAIFADDYYKEEDENDQPIELEGYSQDRVSHRCGTPACAIGHYAYNTPQRWGWSKKGAVIAAEDFDNDWEAQAAHEFCLSRGEYDEITYDEVGNEVEEIFGGEGCGGAKTAKEAAKYIRTFVAKKRKALGLKKPAAKK